MDNALGKGAIISVRYGLISHTCCLYIRIRMGAQCASCDYSLAFLFYSFFQSTIAEVFKIRGQQGQKYWQNSKFILFCNVMAIHDYTPQLYHIIRNCDCGYISVLIIFVVVYLYNIIL